MTECEGAPALGELLLLQGRTPPAAWHAASDEAQVAACYLACHPRVDEVRYPGLRQDPDFPRAACELRGGFGPWVSLRVGASWLRLTCGGDDPRRTVLLLEGLLASGGGPAPAAGEINTTPPACASAATLGSM